MRDSIRVKRPAGIFPLLAGAGLLVMAFILLAAPVDASPAAAPDASPQNAACLTCHSRPDFERQLPGGEILPLTIDGEHFDASVHSGIDCTDCHTGISGFPHPDLQARTRRDFSLALYTPC
ncbi:MAG: hypothetical protein EG825_15910, partial [Rhodocyclaceae bacterium]|nr:hypothetical protein [Rhodocyclaceae bacterium]